MADASAITQRIAQWVTTLTPTAIPRTTHDAALRSLYNYIGCTLHGSTHATVSRAHSAVEPFFARPTSTILNAAVAGSDTNTDAQHAALLNGIASHVHDYDDTHLATIIHPTGPVASALLAYAQHLTSTTQTKISGKTLLVALIAGIEVECKLGLAVYPRHYDAGWHITSTVGAIGAAVAVAKLLALSETQVLHAIGIAASQVTGLRCNFGSDAKCFHVGRAAQNGLLAAVLAAKGFTSEKHGVVEAKRGWANVVTGGVGRNEDVDVGRQLQWYVAELGAVWETEKNSFKPFPCGIVAHPGIDAAVRMRAKILEEQCAGDEVELGQRLRELVFKARVHPLVVELTSNKTPRDGLEAKFSVHHGIAVGLLYGKAGPAEYEDDIVNDVSVVDVRDSVEIAADKVIRSDETVLVAMEKKTEGLIALAVHVDHAVGSLDVPMTDEQLTEKFVDQVGLDVGKEKAQRLSDLCWKMDETDDVDDLLRQLVA